MFRSGVRRGLQSSNNHTRKSNSPTGFQPNYYNDRRTINANLNDFDRQLDFNRPQQRSTYTRNEVYVPSRGRPSQSFNNSGSKRNTDSIQNKDYSLEQSRYNVSKPTTDDFDSRYIRKESIEPQRRPDHPSNNLAMGDGRNVYGSIEPQSWDSELPHSYQRSLSSYNQHQDYQSAQLLNLYQTKNERLDLNIQERQPLVSSRQIQPIVRDRDRSRSARPIDFGNLDRDMYQGSQYVDHANFSTQGFSSLQERRVPSDLREALIDNDLGYQVPICNQDVNEDFKIHDKDQYIHKQGKPFRIIDHYRIDESPSRFHREEAQGSYRGRNSPIPRTYIDSSNGSYSLENNRSRQSDREPGWQAGRSSITRNSRRRNQSLEEDLIRNRMPSRGAVNERFSRSQRSQGVRLKDRLGPIPVLRGGYSQNEDVKIRNAPIGRGRSRQQNYY